MRSAFFGPQLYRLLLVLLLMFLASVVEARKWQLLVKDIQRVSLGRAVRAVFAGQAVGFNTVNRVGESAGRVIFLGEGNRLRGILLSVVGSMSQIIVTFVFGIFGLLYLRYQVLDNSHHLEGLSLVWLDALTYTISIGILLGILLYFRLSSLIQLLEKIPFIAKHRFFVQKLENLHWRELTGILFLSASRYVIFLVQYALLLQVFEVEMHWFDAAAMVSVMLLVLAIVPTIALAELGFRGKISLLLFGLFSTNMLGIIATVAGIWIINLIMPAVIGSLFILGIRLFRNK